MPKSPERCEEIRVEMKNRILHESMLYFARNGFQGTKISELARQIGIAQGTIYVYFESKEELFEEIRKQIRCEDDIKDMRKLSRLPIPAKIKLHKLSEYMLDRLTNDEDFCSMIALNTQMLFEQSSENSSTETTYHSEAYKYMTKMIEQGQREGCVVKGSAMKLTDYYWGVVYLYALKKLFTNQYEMITVEDLERTILK